MAESNNKLAYHLALRFYTIKIQGITIHILSRKCHIESSGRYAKHDQDIKYLMYFDSQWILVFFNKPIFYSVHSEES